MSNKSDDSDSERISDDEASPVSVKGKKPAYVLVFLIARYMLKYLQEGPSGQ
jgi:hypothetical protein